MKLANACARWGSLLMALTARFVQAKNTALHGKLQKSFGPLVDAAPGLLPTY
jgi:hypothetical protein